MRKEGILYYTAPVKKPPFNARKLTVANEKGGRGEKRRGQSHHAAGKR